MPSRNVSTKAGQDHPFGSCSSIPVYKNGIHYRDTPDNTLANTQACIVGGTNDYINWFQVILDPDKNWYTGSGSTGIPANYYDVEGVSTHEFGHVVGGWTPNSAKGHYDPADTPSLCDPLGSETPSHHTMCNKTDDDDESAYWRSLEPHDKDVFQLAYA